MTSDSANSPLEAHPVRIAVPDFVTNSYFPALAAVELGFLEAEGVGAEVRHVFPIPTAMAMLRDGELDYVAGAAHAVLSAFPEWKGAKLLMALARHMYWMLVVRADLKVPRGDVHAVKGLRIGAAPGPDAGLKGLLKEAGIDPERDEVKIGPIPGASGPGVSFGVQAAKALEEGLLDGFWANAMGAEVAVRRGVGTVVVDLRRGDGPPAARSYTFPALVVAERRIKESPDEVAAVIRGVAKTMRALREDPSRAEVVGRKLFPPTEAELIPELIRRDAPFYDPSISQEAVEGMNHFAQDIGLLAGPVPYDQVVAVEFRHLWEA